MIKEEYKGKTIKFNEGWDRWEIATPGSSVGSTIEFQSRSLKKCKEYIDNLKLKPFIPFKVLIRGYGSRKNEIVEIVKVVPNELCGGTFYTKKGEQINFHVLDSFEPTKRNIAILKQIRTLEKNEQKLRDKTHKLLEKMTHVDITNKLKGMVESNETVPKVVCKKQRRKNKGVGGNRRRK